MAAPEVGAVYRVASDPFRGRASPTPLAPTEHDPDPAPLQQWAIEDVVGKEATVVAVVPAGEQGAGELNLEQVVVQWQDGDPTRPNETHGPNRLQPALRSASVTLDQFADHFEAT